MSDARNPEALAEQALRALEEEDPRAARELLVEAVELAPHRADLVNALGVVHLHLGEPEAGRPLIERAIEMAAAEQHDPERRIHAQTMVEGFLLGLAAANEDLDQPAAAAEAYRRVLAQNPRQARARNSLACLLLAWGRTVEGIAELRGYLEDEADEPQFLAGGEALLEAIERARDLKLDPRMFLEAHRGAYVEFFDHHAKEQEARGWIAEAARMMRAPDGQVVPLVPEGARPYAAVRVDLVDPATSQVGQVGDQPMIVALHGFEAMARTPVLIEVVGEDLPLFVSSQAPWDQLPVQVLFRDRGAGDELDRVIGEWYLSGWSGAFGTKDEGRLHYVSDLAPVRDGRGYTLHVDCGRARVDAVAALIEALTALHRRWPMERVVIGRGHLP